jgi:hypothetical protein
MLYIVLAGPNGGAEVGGCATGRNISISVISGRLFISILEI